MYLLSDNPVCSDFEKPRNFPVGLNHCETLERALKSCAVYPVQQREISATLSPWGKALVKCGWTSVPATAFTTLEREGSCMYCFAVATKAAKPETSLTQNASGRK